MRAAVYHGNRDIRIEDVPEPDPGPGDLLLEVAAVGICGTDAAEWAHGPTMYPIWRRHPVTGHIGPMIPGHEIAGTVMEVGPGVEEFEPGDLVVTGAGVSCGACPQCRRGRTNLCERYATLGLQRHGGLARLCVAPASTCVAAPPGLTADAAALGQPMSIAVHSMRRGAPAPEERALVIGIGGIGAFLTYALAASGVPVVAADLDRERLRLASDLGAEATIAAGDESIPAGSLRSGAAPDVVYEVTGTPVCLDAAFEAVREGGRVVAVGLQEEPRTLDVRSLTLRELSLVGTNAHICGIDLPEGLRLLAARAVPWDDVAPLALPLERLVSEGIAPLAEGRSDRVKTLIDPHAEKPRPTRMDGASSGRATTSRQGVNP
jgi:(R,R)-butanediol dehydrogenase/meso-butanediol dehydrogenase/diacetyl reductase